MWIENTYLVHCALCASQAVRLKSPSPSRTTETPQLLQSTELVVKVLACRSFTNNSFRFAAATRLLGLRESVSGSCRSQG